MVAAFEIGLLALGIVSLFRRPGSWPLWLPVAGLAAVRVAATPLLPSGSWAELSPSLHLLRDPLLFLVAAVPLAMLLDRIGLFAALAAAVDGGRHLVAWLWVLAAAVVVVFNLDAAVVLLTPLYVRIARRHGLDVEALAFIPALLACLASGPLPVSNLTNLIVVERFDLSATDVLRHMALPTVGACVVGWLGFRSVFALHAVTDAVDDPVDRRALRRGLPVVALVLVGFTLGDAAGVPAWVVAVVAVSWCVLATRHLPWRAVPVEAVVVALGLTVLVAGAAEHLSLDRVLAGESAELRALFAGTVGSVLTNNLPAVLALAPAFDSPAAVWWLLVGVNMGPVLVISGSLSGLLWRDTARAAGVHVSPARYSRLGVRVGAPAMVVAALLLLV